VVPYHLRRWRRRSSTRLRPSTLRSLPLNG
jgi:hypothetical protein